jgi:hypothetical protein
LTLAAGEAGGVKAYEDLRREVLSGETLGTGSWGLALVIHRGVTAWLLALTLPQDRAACSRPHPRRIDGRSSGPRDAAMTMILAGMILAHRQEVRP